MQNGLLQSLRTRKYTRSYSPVTKRVEACVQNATAKHAWIVWWTERPLSKSNRRVSATIATIIVFCPAKRSQHALRSLYGPIPLLVLLPANCFFSFFPLPLMKTWIPPFTEPVNIVRTKNTFPGAVHFTRVYKHIFNKSISSGVKEAVLH